MLGATLDSPSRKARRVYCPAGMTQPRPLHLTPRQRQLCAHFCIGDSYKDIANALGLNEGTLKVYATNALKATGARNRTQLAVWWTEGRFDPPVIDVFPTVAA